MIDLRSDTVTRPTAAMRRAIADAEVGDDAFGDDPGALRLEAVTAELLGQEAALFFPSGIMANECALQVLCKPGTEVIVEASCHFVDWELGAAATWAGVQLRQIAAPDAMLGADLVERAIRPPLRLQLRTSAISVENTHNAAGGKIMPPPIMKGIVEVARKHSLPLHLDGARLWNAAVALGCAEAEVAAGATTIMVTLSKGLGCPAGSLLAGPRDLIEEARWVRRRLGGQMRQVGILAAAGLYALEHHRGRLAEDHARARQLAARARGIAGLSVIEPETNIVMIDIEDPARSAFEVVAALRQEGVLMTEFTTRRVRAVTHLDVDDAGIARAADALEAIFA